jgi:hypothetical protein
LGSGSGCAGREWQSPCLPTSLPICTYFDHFAHELVLQAGVNLSTPPHPKAILLILLMFSLD